LEAAEAILSLIRERGAVILADLAAAGIRTATWPEEKVPVDHVLNRVVSTGHVIGSVEADGVLRFRLGPRGQRPTGVEEAR
jgi:hypothetical protein